MTFSKQISIGFKGYFKALELLFSKGFILYMLVPFFLSILIFTVGMSQVIDLAVVGRESLIDWINLGSAEFWGAKFLQGTLNVFVTGLIYVLFFITFAFLGGYIMIILMSPLFSIISEKTEFVLTEGKFEYPFNFKQFLKDILRGITIAIRNLSLEMGILFLVFIVGLILSFISWIGVIFMFFISAYFFGFSYMDYSNEREKRSIKESVKFIRKYKWLAIVNGSIFALVLFIPYVGIIISAFVSVISVIAATVSVIEIRKYETPVDSDVFNIID